MPFTKDDIASVKLLSVHLSDPAYPVLDHDALSPNFRSDSLPLWTPNSTDSEPCTVDLGATIPSTIRLGLSWPLGTATSLRVKGVVDESTVIVDDVAPINLNDATPTIDLSIKALSQEVPWGVKGNISWKIVVEEGVEVSIGDHSIELYAICPFLPRYLDDYGVPVELLQLLVLPTLKASPPINTFLDYAKHVVTTLHWGTGMRYDRASGSAYYTNLNEFRIEATFNLTQWAASLRRRKQGPAEKAFFINCFDQAAAVQIGFTLGFTQKAQLDLLRMRFLIPFGFIQPAHLVGWGGTNDLCNSPYYKVPGGGPLTDKQPLSVKDDDKNLKRTPFKSHAFITYDNKVYDATCGPTLGTEDIASYLRSAIDRTTPLYKDLPADLQKFFQGRNLPIGGYADDVLPGPGVIGRATFMSHLQITASDEKQVSGWMEEHKIPQSFPVGDDPENLVEGISMQTFDHELKKTRLTDELGDPQFSSSIGPDGTAELTWKMSSGARQVSLVIQIHKSQDGALNAWKARLSNSSYHHDEEYEVKPKAFELGKHHLAGKTPRTGCHLWISGTLVIFLRGLESNEALRPIVNAVEAALVTPKAGNTTLGDPTLQASTEGPVRVNCIVQVVIKAAGAFRYQVTYETGNVFLLKAESDAANAPGVFTFDFLCRDVGPDKVTFHLAEPTFKTGGRKTIDWNVKVVE